MEEKSGNGGEMQASTSFTALLGLPSSSAMELLQEMERNHHKLLAGSPPISAPQKRKKASHKDNASGKRTKNGDGGGEEEKLPYVHVRARRGQATDSHSLAERARREKINARMKLLQDLVPGCSKVSGTAQVLDEIINHVQSLQRQVEFLSMRLAAVNPSGMELGGIDSFLSASGGTAWMEQPQSQVRLADLLPKSYGKSVVFFSGNPNSTAAL